MAETAPSVSQPCYIDEPPKLTSIKTLAELPGLTSIPSIYTFQTSPNDEPFLDAEESIATIDFFSLLTSNDPDERSKAIQELGKACQDWGFFMVVNHGVAESMMKETIEACRGFFELSDEEKEKFDGKHALSPLRCGTSYNVSLDTVFFWRDFFKFFTNLPKQACCLQVLTYEFQPSKYEIALEYSRRVRQVAREIVRGISKSLGLEENYIDNTLDLENGMQLLVANLYPPCPQPELAMGLPPHSDYGLVTLLIQNQVGGLQVQHKGKWINVNPLPSSFLANIGDHMEILSKGKYKSVVHRAVVNNKDTRISIATPHGPALDAVISAAPELLQQESSPLTYKAMTFKEYLELQQTNKLDGKSCLERIRVTTI